MQTNLWRAIALSIILTACGSNKSTTNEVATPPAPATPLSDQLLLSTLWVQHSLEAKYIYRQSYQQATDKTYENMKSYRGKKPLAVILDLDETVLDNSPYEARLIRNGANYSPESWSKWVNEAQADVIPGAREFLHDMEAHHIEVFYISNRRRDFLEPTMQNLQKLELPFADPEHILLKTEDSSDKTERREMVKQGFKVVLLVGDQMGDFAEPQLINDMQSASSDHGTAGQDSIYQYFVLLPNPMYGSFESGIYGDNHGLTNAEKTLLRKKALETKEGDHHR